MANQIFPIVIPLDGGPVAPTDYTVQLGDRSFILTVAWNERLLAWLLDVADSAGNPLVVGCPLYINSPVLAPYNDSNLPSGDLILMDQTGTGKEATISSLGVDQKLYYFESPAVSS